MLSRKKQNLWLVVVVTLVVGIGGDLTLKSGALAQERTLSLAESVRQAVSSPEGDQQAGIALSADKDLGLSPEEAHKLEVERQAEEAAAQAAKKAKEREIAHNKRSYKRAAQGLLPLSPEQVRTFMHKLESTQRAAIPPVQGPPNGEVKISTVSLDPGARPPVINLAAGYVTTIDIIDHTGQPWPILDVGIGGNFEVTPTEAGSHVVRIVPLTRVGTGNISILLKDLPTPVIFWLNSGGPTYHMRFDARIPAYGPYAKIPLIKRGIEWPVAGGNVLTMLLENSPPSKAQRLKVGGVDARTKAWRVGASVYVRTPHSLLSPSWNASASSADGMTVYEIGNAPVLIMSDNGAMLRARLLQEDR